MRVADNNTYRGVLSTFADDGLKPLHKADDAVKRLEYTATKADAKSNKFT